MKALPIALLTGLAMPLSDDERQQADIIFAREIYPALKWGLTSSSMPFAYVLGGQPGAGKNRLTQILQRSSGGNMMVINGDDFRRHHPDAERLYARHGADAARYTADFAGYITEKAIREASEDGYNLIIEGTFRTARVPLNTLYDLQGKGYRTGVAIMAVPAEISWASVIERYEKQLAVGEAARMTPRSHHDRVVDRLAANANTVYRECKLEDFLVYSREHKLYDSRTQRGLPGEYINAELNRLSLNVLSLGNAKLMDEFTSRLQENPKMPFAEQEARILAFRQSLLDRQISGQAKTTEKKHNRDFER